jgi:hypothetical protein
MTSLLKATGASEAVAMEIVGHDSEAMSRRYTHMPMDVMRQAIGRMARHVQQEVLPRQMNKRKQAK